MAPKLNRVTFRPVRPRIEVANAVDTMDFLSLTQVSLIPIICLILICDILTRRMMMYDKPLTIAQNLTLLAATPLRIATALRM